MSVFLFPVIYILVFYILVRFLRYFLKSTKWNNSYTCLVGKTVIITGANSGIGYYTALDVAKRGARVVLACRNRELAEKAKNDIITTTGNSNIIVKILNLSCFTSVRNFCNDFNANEGRLDILVNNAGIAGVGDKFSEDNLHITWQINYFAPFLLTHLLLNKLKQSSPSRIINISSISAFTANLCLNNLNKYQPSLFNLLSEFYMYRTTKQANILFTIELAEKLKNSGVTTNILHPGMVTTGIWRNLPKQLTGITNIFLNLFCKTAEEGAQTTIYCAVSEDLNGVNGKFFYECKEIPIYKNCTRKLAKEIWNESEKLINLQTSEQI